MTDTSYVRTYNSKPIAANAYYDQDNTAYYLDPASTSNLGTVTASQFNGPLNGNASTATNSAQLG